MKWPEPQGTLERLLRQAQQQIPVHHVIPPETEIINGSLPAGPLIGTLQEFEVFLYHSEYELAWDALASVAKQANAGSGCWYFLALSAAIMKLSERESGALEQAARAPKDGHLSGGLLTVKEPTN